MAGGVASQGADWRWIENLPRATACVGSVTHHGSFAATFHTREFRTRSWDPRARTENQNGLPRHAAMLLRKQKLIWGYSFHICFFFFPLYCRRRFTCNADSSCFPTIFVDPESKYLPEGKHLPEVFVSRVIHKDCFCEVTVQSRQIVRTQTCIVCG